MDSIQEVEMSCEVNSESDEGKKSNNERNSIDQKKDSEVKDITQGFRPPSLQVLDHVKINIEPETPISTLKTLLLFLKSNNSFNKKELKKAEELMSEAFVEFYQKLRLLKSYWYNIHFLFLPTSTSNDMKFSVLEIQNG